MKRIAVIDKEKCNPEGCGGFLCIRVSPGNRMGKEVFVEGTDGKAQVNEEECTDAESITAKKCPFNAIHMVKLPEKLTSRPIHRYGKDGFVLYSLPVPVFGKVVGVLGVNGVGKSTAIKVLAGVLKPNIGKQDSASNIDEIISMFKGTEAQDFFEKVKKGKIKVAYKPQAVDLIPKQAKGKVRDLLENVGEKRKVEAIGKKLDIDKILDSRITEVSGGELQRVAIAATVLKEANVYIFDEPTSYLDIKQRIKVSKFIKELANEKTAVLVVEHDLIILDHITDDVHIMYGEAGGYGIVSLPKPTRAAINTYLSGFLREDNMKFRDHEIKFAARPPQKGGKPVQLLSWHSVKKKLGKFTLETGEGEIARKQVVGVLGENGIGKTTFAKILAGVLKQDSGEISSNIKVAYKPQYLSSDSDELVMSFLGKAVEKYKVHLIRPLDIEPLLLRKLNALSGGELQRVSIAKCLSEEADLYLLDEPSAYLDVEQRLNVSRIIRERMEQLGKTAFVVDHDLLFIDYLSDNLTIFSGEPAVSGVVNGPFPMEEGMNRFLSDLNITLRRDKDSLRPRINKEDSQMDKKQKGEGKLYYG
ncbi:ribosome biogenesis/translation initiation ATPase RLI [Candidatus Woesearchaeota archaeon]|nr:ribosome biogenesis/translation initiation ATPase RLI [Candidatus Woesearchaeota archaeon]